MEEAVECADEVGALKELRLVEAATPRDVDGRVGERKQGDAGVEAR
jgi:hypothetical protein